MNETASLVKKIFDPYFEAPLEIWQSFASHLERNSYKKNEIIKDVNRKEHNLSIITKGSAGIFLWKENSTICLDGLWLEKGLLGDTANLDFTTIPYWGEDGHLENNWSGKRGKALSSMLAILAHDPDSGIINYGNTNVMHKNESDQVLEFLDFYRQGGGDNLNFLVFDSKFTTYQNLARLDDENIKFLTIRRRGKNMISKIEQQPFSQWKSIRVQAAGNKKRTLRILDQNVLLKGYDKNIRQITITGHGKTKPALIITNDFDLPAQLVVRRYSRRWLVEKAISEQIEFFHLNRLSSSIVIKVDFRPDHVHTYPQPL
jgi:hypothetical protein